LSGDDIRALLRGGGVRFVFADVGHPFAWVDGPVLFDIWKLRSSLTWRPWTPRFSLTRSRASTRISRHCGYRRQDLATSARSFCSRRATEPDPQPDGDSRQDRRQHAHAQPIPGWPATVAWAQLSHVQKDAGSRPMRVAP
jgi:hypothetical protein